MLTVLEKLGKAWLGLTNEHIKLFLLEAKLAKANIVPLIMTLVFFFLLVVSGWCLILVLSGYGIYVWSQSILITILGTLALNFVLMILMVVLMYLYIQPMLFAHSRRQLNRYYEKKHAYEEEQNQTRN